MEKNLWAKGATLSESDGFICKILVFVLLRPHISQSFTHKFSTVSEYMDNFASCHEFRSSLKAPGESKNVYTFNEP